MSLCLLLKLLKVVGLFIYIDELLDILKKLRIRQNENKLKYGEFSIKNIFNEKEYDFIFTWENGSSIHPMYYLNKLKKVLIKANINKDLRFHHSFKVHILHERFICNLPPYNATFKAISSRSSTVYSKRTFYLFH